MTWNDFLAACALMGRRKALDAILNNRKLWKIEDAHALHMRAHLHEKDHAELLRSLLIHYGVIEPDGEKHEVG